MADSFAHLHVHTEYSILDGAARLKDLFAEVARLGMPALAMTDHGNMHGAYDFYRQAVAAGVTPILGVEAYKTPGTHRGDKTKVKWNGGGDADVGGGGAYTHMTILAQSATGLRNLIKLVSRSSQEGQIHAGRGYAPRVDEELLAEYAPGLIATTGCMGGEVHTWLRIGNYERARASAGRLVEIFGRDNTFLEIMDHGIADERAVRADLLRLGKDVGIRPLATNDSHYVTADQAEMHDAFLCVQTKSPLSAAKRFRFDGEGYHIKSPEEMRALWDDAVPGACDNTLLVAEGVTSYDEVFAPRDLMPSFPVPDGETEESWFRKETLAGLARRFPRGVPTEHLAQAEYELGVIVQMGFPSYFLIVADFIAWAKAHGIAVGPGRGSAAGSLVAYALGITDLDPIPLGLIFERFLNPERVSMPDVDIDFDPDRRGEVIEYVTRRWGADRVAQISTFGTIKAKQAINDSARVLELPAHLASKMTGLLPKPISGRDAGLACVDDEGDPRYGDAGELRALVSSDEQAGQIYTSARRIENYLRQVGVHAAAVVMSPVPLTDVLPVWMRKDGAVITQWDMGAVEDLGLLKMDFLGLRNLAVAAEAVRNIKANRGLDVTLPTEQLDDPATYALLARGDTLGVFQLDGGPIRSLLRAMRPSTFEDISAVLALYRPGPMGVDAHLAYANRKNGRAEIEPIHPELAEPLAEILDPTYGVIVYQEQVQRAAQILAGYTLGQADLLRRAMGKKKPEVLAKEFIPFRDGCRERGYSDEAIQAVWDTLVPFAGYAFNKAHSAAYGLIAYWTAYLKANYPAEYMAALLTSVKDNPDRRALYLGECRRMGIRVLTPDVNASLRNFAAVGADVRFGLVSVKDVGAGVVDALLQGREERGEARSFADWLAKAPSGALQKQAVAALIKAGAFDSLGHPRRGLLDVHAGALAGVSNGKKAEARGQDGLFGLVSDTAGEFGAVSVEVPAREWPKAQRLALEREVLGLYVSDHPLAGMEQVLSGAGKDSIAELLAAAGGDEDEAALEIEQPAAYVDGQFVQVAGIITEFEVRTSKAGKRYAPMVLEDRDGAALSVLLFEKTLDALGPSLGLLAADVVVKVRGRLKIEDGEVKVFGNDVGVLESTDASRRAARRVTLNVKAEEVTRERLAKLRELAHVYPGQSPVLMRMWSDDENRESVVVLPMRLRNDLHVFREITTIFGPNSLAA